MIETSRTTNLDLKNIGQNVCIQQGARACSEYLRAEVSVALVCLVARNTYVAPVLSHIIPILQ